MPYKENRVFYQASNTYSTLNSLTSETHNIWFSCHGMGFLSRYFIRYFRGLNENENYIIAPQAPSKYYQSSDFKYIGANWLTRENTSPETENILNYFDAIWKAENIPAGKKMVLFGFSQGVSVSMRWMVSRQVEPEMLVIYAGTIPKELTSGDFDYLGEIKVKMVYGRKDQYINAESGRLKKQIDFAKRLFGEENLDIITFPGKHEMKPEVIRDLVRK